jgi:F-type H+-transporting ATPase subunit a
MHKREVLLRLPRVFGVDLSITPEIVLLWVAAAATVLLLTPACRRRSLVAHGRMQNLVDALVAFVDREIVRDAVGPGRGLTAFFLFTLFFFILVCDLLGVLLVASPYRALTANLSVTAALALMVFALTLGLNVRRHGVLGFLRGFVPRGVPLWITPLMVPIEVISWLAKPFSLAVRLFANMMVGHTLILVFIGMQAAAVWYLKTVPLAGAVVMTGFEIFVSIVQAFIFTMLTGFYIREALE